METTTRERSRSARYGATTRPGFCRAALIALAALGIFTAAAPPLRAQTAAQVTNGSGAFALAEHYDADAKANGIWFARISSPGVLQVYKAPLPTAGGNQLAGNPPLRGFPNGKISGGNGAPTWYAPNVAPVAEAQDSNTVGLFAAVRDSVSGPQRIQYFEFGGNNWTRCGWSIDAEPMDPKAPSFGAFSWDSDPTSGGREFYVAYANTSGVITVQQIWPGAVTPGGLTSSYAYIAHIRPPTGITGWDGGVAACVTDNLADGSPDEPKLFWIALNSDKGVYVGCSRMANSEGFWSGRTPYMDNTTTWTLVPKGSDGIALPDPAFAGPVVGLHKGADGVVYLNYLSLLRDRNIYRKLTRTAPSYSVTAGPEQGARAYFGNGGKLATRPAALYTYDAPVTTADQSATIPVYRNWAYYISGDSGYASGFYNEPAKIGSARRVKIPTITHNEAMQSPLVGIIEGPPPVPNENIKNGPGNLADFGHTRYGQTVGQSTDQNIATSLTLIAKAKAAAGAFFAKVSAEADLELGGNVKWGSSTENSVMTAYQATALPVKEADGQWKVLGNGIAFLMESSFTGFAYQFADASGNIVPEAPQYLQLIPLDPIVKAYPFAFNPNATSGIIPGEIHSYLMPAPDRINLENQSAYDFATGVNPDGTPVTLATNSKRSIYYGWAEGGSAGEEAETISSHYLGGGIDFSLEVLVGGEVKTGFFDGEVQGGVKTTFNWDMNTTNSVKNQIATEVEFPAVEPAPGVYQRYGYYTLNLRENPAYTQQLLTLLSGYNDPAGNNLNLLKRIAPGSSPWKVTYAIDENVDGTGDYYQVPGGALVAAAQGAAALGAPAPIPASLTAKGVTSHKQIGLLLAALRQSNQPGPPAAQPAPPSRPGARPRHSNAVPAEAVALLARLTPSERADLVTYVKGQQAQSRQAFLRRHPNWKPRTFPDPKNNLPSLPARPAGGNAAQGAKMDKVPASNPRIKSQRMTVPR